MVVALAATDRQAEEDCARCIDPVDDRLDAKLFDVDSAFLIDGVLR